MDFDIISLKLREVRLGTRGSRLALVQSERVAARLRELGLTVRVVKIVTEGDTRPVDLSPGEGVFVAAIERALLSGDIDVAVHSAKDVPLESDPRLCIAAFPERADPRDALLSRRGRQSLDLLPAGSTVGTDSPRRTGFLRALRPDLNVVPLHGNVDTRIARLDFGVVDALVVAAAGVDRLGRSERIDERLDPGAVAPAPGQGALAVQARAADRELGEALARIDSRDLRVAVELEREVLRATGGTCRAPVGALASVGDGVAQLLVAAVHADGSNKHVERIESPLGEALARAREAGLRLVAEGAVP